LERHIVARRNGDVAARTVADHIAFDRNAFREYAEILGAGMRSDVTDDRGIREYLMWEDDAMSLAVETTFGMQEAVAARAASRTEERENRIAVLAQPGGVALADDLQRVATRIDRLGRYYPDVRPVDPAALAAGRPGAVLAAAAVLERIIQTNDLLGIGYLEGGVAAARAVGRISIRDERGRLRGYGTGSLVSPELLLTNHHVLTDAGVAAHSIVEFDYQDGIDGLPLSVQAFGLDPQRFFIADETLDFALVAVRADAGTLAPRGFNRLIEAEGKAIVGDFVTIIQHPEGGKKQIALRENRIVDMLPDFLHYETDTEPGSSGSPVFNDQWEIVALHHASVRAPGNAELGEHLNEGLRVSRLFGRLRTTGFTPARQALVDALFDGTPRTPAPTPEAVHPVASPRTFTIPLKIRLLGDSLDLDVRTPTAEAVEIDPDYGNREGYDPDFLTGHRVPLPALHAQDVPSAAVDQLATVTPPYELRYHHFSVVQNKVRRLAFFTAVNIDGATSQRLRRDRDKWKLDPRAPADVQAGEEVYKNNPLDRGHLVRRLDPAWGTSQQIAKLGNDDTFHFTNCSPQHEDFNQNQTTWAGLEDYVLEHADNLDLKVTVLTGPILAEDDDTYRGVRLPRQYWKVVAMVKTTGELSATGYLLSQASLIDGLETAPAEFSYGAYQTFQVPVRRIEELTRLSFGDLHDSDPFTGQESTTDASEVTHLRQLAL
jgi:endonuclease G